MLAGIELADPELSARVAAGLARVEDLLERELISEFSFVTEAASHLMHAGGKRFRPLFTLVAAGVGPRPDAEDVIVASAVVELIHLATLYHDDVMDEADLRRGAKSANARWDNSIAILTGDFLFAHASRLVAGLGPDAVRIIAETFAELVTGQTRETVGAGPDDDPIAHHLQVLDEKTAALIDTCARYAGHVLRRPRSEETAALRRYGRAVGMAFQISDDIIDISSTDSGQDTGHRPAGGRAHPAGALHAGRPGGRSAAAGAGLRADHRSEDELREAVELLTLLAGDGRGPADPDRLRRRGERRTGAAAGVVVAGRALLAGPVRHRPHPLRAVARVLRCAGSRSYSVGHAVPLTVTPPQYYPRPA